MKAKKIFKAVLAVGTLAGVGFGAYKFGEFVGEDKEKKKHSSDDDDYLFDDDFADDDDEDYDFYSDDDVGEEEKEVDWREKYNDLLEKHNKLREELQVCSEEAKSFSEMNNNLLVELLKADELQKENYDLSIENERLKEDNAELENDRDLWQADSEYRKKSCNRNGVLIKIEPKSKEAKIFTPYNEAFVNKIREIDGRKWRKSELCWIIPLSEVVNVHQILYDVYGRVGDIWIDDIVANEENMTCEEKTEVQKDESED